MAELLDRVFALPTELRTLILQYAFSNPRPRVKCSLYAESVSTPFVLKRNHLWFQHGSPWLSELLDNEDLSPAIRKGLVDAVVECARFVIDHDNLPRLVRSEIHPTQLLWRGVDFGKTVKNLEIALKIRFSALDDGTPGDLDMLLARDIHSFDSLTSLSISLTGKSEILGWTMVRDYLAKLVALCQSHVPAKMQHDIRVQLVFWIMRGFGSECYKMPVVIERPNCLSLDRLRIWVEWTRCHGGRRDAWWKRLEELQQIEE